VANISEGMQQDSSSFLQFNNKCVINKIAHVACILYPSMALALSEDI